MVAPLPLTASKVLNHISGNHTHWRNQMSDEKETKETKDGELSKDELKQVTGGKPAAAPPPKPPVDYFLTLDGIAGESQD
jgi:bacteriocin-like protein